jgi:hypothetical protein
LGIEAPPEVVVLREEVVPHAAPASIGRALPEPLAQRLQATTARLAELRNQIDAGQLDEAQETIAQIEQELRAVHGTTEDITPKPRATLQPPFVRK